jgi:5'-nucleotidase (lipoprotein e(P4) family)
MSKRKILVFHFMIIMTLSIFGLNCNRNETQEEDSKVTNDIKWVRSSVEYQAICVQTYRWAWKSVKIASKQISLPWAVVLDVDETVLDNSPYEAMIAMEGSKYPAGWSEWVLSADAEAVPGAKAFLDSVNTLGNNAHIVFITNRDTSFEHATLENLKQLNMWTDHCLMLCRRDKGDTKTVRQNEVKTGTGRCEGMGEQKIIVLIGDQLPDVAEFASGANPEGLRNTFKNSPIWGSTSFILPNPMYGSWQSGYK